MDKARLSENPVGPRSGGATIQGSWQNAVGEQGEHSIRNHSRETTEGEIQQVSFRRSGTLEFNDAILNEVIDRINEVKVLRLTWGYHLLFGSEPDISLRDPDDTPIFVAVEVKGVVQ